MVGVLLFLHVLSAAAWIGGGLFAVFVTGRLATSGIDGSGRSMQRLSEGADRYFGPSAGLTLLTGILLVLTSDPYGWGDTFVIIGLGVFVFSAAYRPLVASKGEQRLLEAVLGDGSDTRAALGFVYRDSTIEIAALLIALWAMLTKLGA